MDDETEIIIKEQIGKLPKEVVTFLSSTSWSSDLDEIGSLYNLSREEFSAFKREASLVLAGLIHPDEFKEVLEKEAGLEGTVLEALVTNVEKKIFAPIRPALIEFFEKEARENTENVVDPEKPRVQMPDVAPDNLPTEEGSDSLIPPIPSRFGRGEEEIPSHPFEEKMKKVFTAGQQSMGELTLETPTQKASVPQTPKAPPIYQADPYREAIE